MSTGKCISVICHRFVFFFFKQKTAYEMRISDWSSDVCSSDLAVQLTPGANALSTAEGIRTQMAELSKGFPPDVTWSIPYDTTPFISLLIEEVVKTLGEAMLLVFLVMFLFLQNWRATVIQTVVVSIALVGACLGLWLFGFPIHVLTLFGMVLAIGILVD